MTTHVIGFDAAACFDGVAASYDLLTRDHDYELWLGGLLPLLGGLRVGSLLDCGCGTGASAQPMVRRGWRVVGCDISEQMLGIAATRLPGVELHQADIRALPAYGRFDLVWALCDVVNFILDEDELVAAFCGMRANLADDGRLLFDANTLASFRGFFAEEHEIAEGDRRVTWVGEVDAGAFEAGGVAQAHIVAGEQPPVAHVERHWPRPVIEEALDAAGLKVHGVWGHGYDARPETPLDEDFHTKAIYVAGKR